MTPSTRPCSRSPFSSLRLSFLYRTLQWKDPAPSSFPPFSYVSQISSSHRTVASSDHFGWIRAGNNLSLTSSTRSKANSFMRTIFHWSFKKVGLVTWSHAFPLTYFPSSRPLSSRVGEPLPFSFFTYSPLPDTRFPTTTPMITFSFSMSFFRSSLNSFRFL